MPQHEIPMEQYDGQDTYADHMRGYLKAIDFYSYKLRKSYNDGVEDRESHHALVSLCCQSWIQLFPKVMNKPDISKSFMKWQNVIWDSHILLEPRNANLIWLFVIHIRMVFEHLGLTSIEGE